MDDTKSEKNINLIILLVSVISVFVLATYFWRFNDSLAFSQDIFGLFGDFFGGVISTLISLIAVLLIYRTYHLQKEELKKTSRALNNQNEHLKLEQYQNIFFKLLQRKDEMLLNLNKNDNSNDLRDLISSFEIASRRYQGKKWQALKEVCDNYGGMFHSYIHSVVSLTNYVYDFNADDGNSSFLKYKLENILKTNFNDDESKVLDYYLEYYSHFDENNTEVNVFRAYVNKKGLFELSEENKKFVSRNNHKNLLT